ncbi:MAG: alpha/beta hydrolase [Bacteroides sp.]|nr:alpha/beta hydrolase [Bacteroides sp.]MDE7471746.1 alpha/beta hydrolase [Paramuribaculum sp.]
MKQSLEINGLNVCYDVSGSGSPLILMHGWGCSHSTVKSIAQIASETNTVYNIDLPGFGDSEEPDSVWSVEDYTIFIEKFAEKLKIENPVLIGHSFGGRISILMASRQRVNKVVLVDAAGVKPKRSAKYYVKVYSFKLMRLLAETFIGKEKSKAWIERRRAKVGSADYAAASPCMRAILSKCVNEDLKSVMPRISAPTLLIWGENDTATPVRDAKIMDKLIPDTGLVIFENAGHYSFLDCPGRFAAVLRSFLKS